MRLEFQAVGLRNLELLRTERDVAGRFLLGLENLNSILWAGGGLDLHIGLSAFSLSTSYIRSHTKYNAQSLRSVYVPPTFRLRSTHNKHTEPS